MLSHLRKNAPCVDLANNPSNPLPILVRLVARAVLHPDRFGERSMKHVWCSQTPFCHDLYTQSVSLFWRPNHGRGTLPPRILSSEDTYQSPCSCSCMDSVHRWRPATELANVRSALQERGKAYSCC